MAFPLTNHVQSIIGWTQQQEPPIETQKQIAHPIETSAHTIEEYMQWAATTPAVGLFYDQSQEDIQTGALRQITSLNDLPTDRSVLIDTSYVTVENRMISDPKKKGWKTQSYLEIHPGFLLFYPTNKDTWTACMTYYDGYRPSPFRFTYTKSGLSASKQDWDRWINDGRVWINDQPLRKMFSKHDPHVLVRTKKGRIPVIQVNKETETPILFV